MDIAGLCDGQTIHLVRKQDSEKAKKMYPFQMKSLNNLLCQEIMRMIPVF